jgi:hypothetical protein
MANITKKELIERIADTHQIRARQSFLDEIVIVERAGSSVCLIRTESK